MIDICKFLSSINFKLKDGEDSLIYEKLYNKFENYKITVQLDEKDYTKSVINYGKDIKYGRKVTQNLHQKETFVVLECVDRLLTNGYSPKEIILEKDYPSGRKERGQFLDILITKEGLPYYMIECKTWGEEYNKELNNLISDGGQLLTYYTNDRDVKAICLYTSTFRNNFIENDFKLIDTSDFDGSDKKDLYKNWDKEFSDVNIFKNAYGINTIGVTYEDLKPLSEDKKLYNGFARILRKYAVSDLTNAYNKLFNLFLCKIVDEDKLCTDKNYKIQFQWKKEDTSYDVLDRLSNLYNEGISKYLKINVTDYSKSKFLKDIEFLLKGNKELGAELLKEFNELRFIKNNEFAFIEVFNMETFKQNSLILKAVVKLFERVKIKYSDKQQFLGDFFERLLNIGIKQTEGQFFTPIPIANFIVNSIPFETIIDEKIKNGDDYFLPYMIDYACGAGHFITEYMHRIEPILNKYKESDFNTNLQIQNFKQWADNQYKWAKEFVYGIEKDYRLTKTSKIACFLNGDGDANIITANGLDSFDSEIFNNSIFYQNTLEKNYQKDSPVFDCVIANPPYSVQDFKDTLKKSNEEPYGDKNFNLFKDLGNNSDDIECLFMERTKQLVKEGGIAAIVIANTFLTNPGIHQKTRELIIENFKIKGIVELGSGAFMATGTNTIVLFMQKRTQTEINAIRTLVDNFCNDPKDINFNNKPKIISKFIKDVYTDLTFEDYSSLFNKKLTKEFKKSDLYEEYIDSIIEKLETSLSKKKKEAEIKKIQEEINNISNGTKEVDIDPLIKNECKKLYYYLINDEIKTIVISAGENKDDVSEFLGYKFSKRKGDEGLKELSDKDIKEIDTYAKRESVNSKLYNPENILDNSKVNYYIYKNFLGKISNQDLNYMKQSFFDMQYDDLNKFFDYNVNDFNTSLYLESKKKIVFETKYPLIKLKNIKNIIIEKGDSAPQRKENFSNGIKPFIRAGNLNILNSKKYIIPDPKSYVNKDAISNYKLKLFKKGTVLFPVSGKSIDTNNIGFLEEDSYVVNHLIGIYHPNEKVCKFLYEIFNKYKISNLKSNSSDYPTIKELSVKNFKIPNIDITIISKIINEIEYIYEDCISKKNNIQSLESKIDSILNKHKTLKQDKLSKYLKLEYGIALPDRERISGVYPVVGSNGVVGCHKEYLLEGPNVIIGRKGSVGKVNYIENNCTPIDTTFYVKPNKSKILLKYSYYLLKSLNLENLNKGLGPGGVNRNKIYNIKVSIPNTSIQQKILDEVQPLEKAIEELRKEIDEMIAKKQAILDKYLK